MNTIDQQFNTVQDKLQGLLKYIGQLQRENAQLRAQVAQAHAGEAAAQADVAELKQQATVLKFAAGRLNERDKKEFDTAISRYIRQLDKCIAYLSQ